MSFIHIGWLKTKLQRVIFLGIFEKSLSIHQTQHVCHTCRVALEKKQWFSPSLYDNNIEYTKMSKDKKCAPNRF